MEYFKIIFVSFVLFVNIIFSNFVSDIMKVKFSISSFKFCPQSDNILKHLVKVSLSQCVEECATRTDCNSINYFNKFHTCELIPYEVCMLDENQQTNRVCIFVKKTDMDLSEVNGKCDCGSGMTCELKPDAKCVPQECEGFTIRFGKVNGNMRSIGATVTFECNQMYIETFQKREATCLPNGNWSYRPDCYKDTKGKNICSGCIHPRDCQDIQAINKTAETGIFQIHPIGSDVFEVRCDMDTPPGGWTVFQRRESRSNFLQDWETFKEGFGRLENNFWLGNDKIWKLTRSELYKLRVDLRDQDGSEGYAEYSLFSIGDESTNYMLNIADHNGTATDSLIGRHNGMMFSTIDQDHDAYHANCASMFQGAWWYSNCQSSNLNGRYGNVECNRGMTWKNWKNDCTFMRFTEMKIRRN